MLKQVYPTFPKANIGSTGYIAAGWKRRTKERNQVDDPGTVRHLWRSLKSVRREDTIFEHTGSAIAIVVAASVYNFAVLITTYIIIPSLPICVASFTFVRFVHDKPTFKQLYDLVGRLFTQNAVTMINNKYILAALFVLQAGCSSMAADISDHSLKSTPVLARQPEMLNLLTLEKGQKDSKVRIENPLTDPIHEHELDDEMSGMTPEACVEKAHWVYDKEALPALKRYCKEKVAGVVSKEAESVYQRALHRVDTLLVRGATKHASTLRPDERAHYFAEIRRLLCLFKKLIRKLEYYCFEKLKHERGMGRGCPEAGEKLKKYNEVTNIFWHAAKKALLERQPSYDDFIGSFQYIRHKPPSDGQSMDGTALSVLDEPLHTLPLLLGSDGNPTDLMTNRSRLNGYGHRPDGVPNVMHVKAAQERDAAIKEAGEMLYQAISIAYKEIMTNCDKSSPCYERSLALFEARKQMAKNRLEREICVAKWNYQKAVGLPLLSVDHANVVPNDSSDDEPQGYRLDRDGIYPFTLIVIAFLAWKVVAVFSNIVYESKDERAIARIATYIFGAIVSTSNRIAGVFGAAGTMLGHFVCKLFSVKKGSNYYIIVVLCALISALIGDKLQGMYEEEKLREDVGPVTCH